MIVLAVWLLALPFRIAYRLGFKGTVVVVCLLVILTSGFSMLVDLGVLYPPPAEASPGRPGRRPATASPPPSSAAKGDVPGRYLTLYRKAGAGERWGGLPAWAVLAGIGKVESDHGRSRAPGVRSGVNAFGCCAGPMQFNLRNGPPSTWDRYGRGSPYDPADAIAAAARYLRASGARRSLDGALYAYNNSSAYVAGVKRLARRYGGR